MRLEGRLQLRQRRMLMLAENNSVAPLLKRRPVRTMLSVC